MPTTLANVRICRTKGLRLVAWRLVLFAAALLLNGAYVYANDAYEFRFNYREGDQYRILSTVQQNVRINGVYSHSATILNKASIEVSDVGESDARISAMYHTSEESTGHGQVYRWGEEYPTEFRRDTVGRFDISPEYFMPVVRNVPVFPEEPISPGYSWTHAGSEVHDFRRNFGLDEAFHFPIDVVYEYMGTAELDGTEFHQFSIRYNVFHQAPQKPEIRTAYPMLITGFSDQILYWDYARGRPHYYEETYTFLVHLTDGTVAQFSGEADGRVVESEPLNRQAAVDDIRNLLDELDIDESDVQEDERGVTITLENVQFAPDSAVLRDSERAKLDRLAEILKRYGEYDLLVTGHTALAGTEAGRLHLSRERADSVAEYLLELDVRERDQILTRGFGADIPVADNMTEAGRRRNRRVELTILEN
ncbi:MAG: OmpA family protein [Spirochaeta sp.]|nr:OmpA family protein [Spirochaeta sp.]